MTVTAARSPLADRAALARAALARAEEHTGARRHLWVGRQAGERALDALPGTGRGPLALPVDARLAHVLPGGLERGSAVAVVGSTSLVLALLAEASAEGAWVAVVGLPMLGVLAAHQSGLDLGRVVLVPDAGPDGPRVVAALLDGVDAVVVAGVALSDADRRRLGARARERGSVLLSTAPWPGASVVLTAETACWDGVGRGDGRLRQHLLTVGRRGRGAAARGWRGEVRLPLSPADGALGVRAGGVRAADGVAVRGPRAEPVVTRGPVPETGGRRRAG